MSNISSDSSKKKLNKTWPLANVYGPVQDEYKDHFLCELANMCANIKHPLLMGGDFNILRCSDDKNKKFVNNRFSELFNRIINMYELRDLALHGGKCTWSNNRADLTLEKLDRVFISKNWELDFPLCNIKKIPRYVSDHNPIVYSNDMECNRTT